MIADLAYHLYDKTPPWLRMFIPIMSQKQTYDIVTDDSIGFEEQIIAMSVGTLSLIHI